MSKFRDEDEFNIDEDQRYALVKTMIWTMKTADQMTMKTMKTMIWMKIIIWTMIIQITEQKQKIRRGTLTMTMIGFLMRIEESMETIRRKNRMI